MLALIFTFGFTIFLLLLLIINLVNSHSTRSWDTEGSIMYLILCMGIAVGSSFCLKLLLGMVLTPTP